MSQDKNRCGRCHKIIGERIANSDAKLYCPLCGYTEGEPVVPCVWSCGRCGHLDIDKKSTVRPFCPECWENEEKVRMTAMLAKPSDVNGLGTGVVDLELGYELLINAQAADLELGTELLRDAQDAI